MAAQRIYLDHAATTPILETVRDAIAWELDHWANASSPYAEGRAAHSRLEEARAHIKQLLGWKGELIFTSGASESIGIAMRGAKRERRLVSAVEHDALRRTGVGFEEVGVDQAGQVHPAAIDARDALVAVQTVNNETGIIQPIDEVIAAVRRQGGLVLADCAQSLGKLPLPDADFIAISGHKIGGPPGIGALLVRDLSTLEATGGHERGYRAGTENLPGITGFAVAVEALRPWMVRATDMRAHLERVLRQAGAQVVGADARRLPTIGSYRMPGVAAAAQLIEFDMGGISVSAGSACSSGSIKPSHVLAAMGWDETAAREVIRVSFGYETSRADIYGFTEAWTRIAADNGVRAT